MVKIAAKLITKVATVMPERTGFRRKLSEARRASTQDRPGSRIAHCQNHPTPWLIIRGQRNASPSKKINIPITPTLNCCTDPGKGEGRKMMMGEATKQMRPSRIAQDFFPRREGLQTVCLAFFRGLTRTASSAGYSRATSATDRPVARGTPNYRVEK